MRVKITLACTECKQRNYNTMKNKKNDPDRLEMSKYCKFLPVEIVFGKKKEWKDGKQVDTDEDNVINNVHPAWTKKPADLTEEDYNTFYHELYPAQMDEPLFHIHRQP